MTMLPKYFDRHYFETLKLLSDNPKVRFYQRDVARALGINMEAANRTLKLLAEEGILRVEKRGRANVYRFDHSSPLARQMRVLFNLADLNDLLPRLRRHVRQLWLIGKCAEGTDSAEDPVELLAIPRRKYEELLYEVEKYEGRIGREIIVQLAKEGSEGIRLI